MFFFATKLSLADTDDKDADAARIGSSAKTTYLMREKI